MYEIATKNQSSLCVADGREHARVNEKTAPAKRLMIEEKFEEIAEFEW